MFVTRAFTSFLVHYSLVISIRPLSSLLQQYYFFFRATQFLHMATQAQGFTRRSIDKTQKYIGQYDLA